MAIDASHNPIMIEGETISSSTKLTDEFCYVQKVVWYGVTTAAHKARITDKNGKTLFPFTADAPGASGEMMYTYDFPHSPHPCNGLYVDDLDSGNLYIYTAMRETMM